MRIRLLGPIEARDSDGRLLEIGPRLQRALLALLALTPGRVVGTDRITFELWGDDVTPATANTLQAYVSRLRKVLGPDAILTKAPGYVLAVRPEAIDTVRFAELTEEARLAYDSADPETAARCLREALDLWTGPALADLVDVPFAERESVSLEEARVRAIEERIRADLDLGRHGDVAVELSGLIALHPHRERLYAQQMLALYRCNRQSDALATYEALRTLLLHELGVDPTPEVQRLHDAILLQKPELDWLPPLTPTNDAAPRTTIPLQGIVAALPEAGSFVGRAGEVSAIVDAYEAVASGDGRRVVIVAGEPGVGKTAVAAHCARLAHEHGATVLYGRCDEGLSAPYQPFAEVLTHLITGAGLAVGGQALARIVPSLWTDATLPMSDPDEERRAMYAAVSDALADEAEHRPVVLVVDDLHWADRPTLMLLRHLATATDAPAILIIATFRQAEATSDHPLRELLAALHRSSGVVRLDLYGWTCGEVAKYLDVLGASDDAERLHASTGGNPFFVQAMVRHAADGAVDAVPVSIVEVLTDRVARLGDDVRRVLDTAAVAGREFDATVVATATGTTLDRALTDLQVSVDAQIVTEARERPGRFSFQHALYRDALYEGLGASRAARLHRAVAEALESEPAADAADVARHWEHALPFDATKGTEAYAKAGEQALAAVAGDIAVAWYRKALDLQPADPGVRARLLTGLGDAQLQAGDREFRRTLLAAARLALDCGDTDQLVRAVAANTARVPTATSLDAESVAMLEEALAMTAGDSEGRARMTAALALARTFSDDWQRRCALAEDAIAMARRLRDPQTLLRVLMLVPGAIDGPRTLAARVRYATEARDLARAFDDLGAEFTASSYLACAKLEDGRPEEAGTIVDSCDAIAHRLNQSHTLWWTYGWRASVALISGDLDLAEALAKRAADAGAEAGIPDAAMGYASQAAEVNRHRGDPMATVPMFEQAMLFAPDIAVIRAELALLYADAGRSEDARALLQRDAASDFDAVRHDPLWMMAMACYAEVCAEIGDRDVAASLLAILRPLGPRVAHSALVNRGSVSLYTGMLSRLLGSHDEAENDFRAATAMHERMGADLLTARTQIEWGRLLVACGDLDQARSRLDAGAATARSCGSVWLVARAETIAESV